MSTKSTRASGHQALRFQENQTSNKKSKCSQARTLETTGRARSLSENCIAKCPVSFRRAPLQRDFGTPDRLPPTNTVEALEQIRRMRGGAQSHLMRCSDGGLYVVKFQNNPQGPRILCNELVGAQIAHFMNLPVPRFSLVYVSPDLIRNTEDLVMQLRHSRTPCRSGWCFGSRHVCDVGPRSSTQVRTAWDLIPDAQLSRIENRESFAGMLVFDQWTCNTDHRQTVFVRDGKDRGVFAHMIDNGFCFGGTDWRFDDAPLRGVYERPSAYDFIRDFDAFEPWLDSVERRIDLRSLEAMANGVPLEWNNRDAETLEALIGTLDRRRKRVRELVWLSVKAARSAFRNFNAPLIVEMPPSHGETGNSRPGLVRAHSPGFAFRPSPSRHKR